MNVKVIGAAGGEVTGSCYLLETRRARIMIDCGMFQGGRKSESLNRPPTRPEPRLDAVLLTHAHLDHTGRLPLLPELGYRGPVFATPATIDMAELILRDSAKIQSQDALRQSRRLEREGKLPKPPLYEMEDAQQIISQMRPVAYNKPFPVADGIVATWVEAGHMLGSATIKLTVNDDGCTKSVIFSGDLGPRGVPILRDYEPFHQADAVFLESTYGDHDHRPFGQTVEEFVQIVKNAVATGGRILVPTFAVGRAQLLITLLGAMFRKKLMEPFPLFLDSPMAIEATKIYVKHREIFDDQMKSYIAGRPLREDLKTLKATVTPQESMKINNHQGVCLIMAGAGMCNAGRILHHLKQNLWKQEAHVMIVGYQGYGSLGRKLVERHPMVRIHGESVVVRAQIHTLGGFSAHAGQSDLLNWFSAVAPSKPRLVLTHGENKPRQALAALIQKRFQIKASTPGLRESIAL